MRIEEDLLLQREGEFSDPDRNEIVGTLKDMMKFFIDEKCELHEQELIKVPNYANRAQEASIVRVLEYEGYTMGLATDLYAEFVGFGSRVEDDIYYHITYLTPDVSRSKKISYSYSNHPDIVFNHIPRIFFSVREIFQEAEIREGKIRDLVKESNKKVHEG